MCQHDFPRKFLRKFILNIQVLLPLNYTNTCLIYEVKKMGVILGTLPLCMYVILHLLYCT